MYYIYTKTDREISKDNIFSQKSNMKLSDFDRKNPVRTDQGYVVLAQANTEKDMLKKKSVILKNLER